MADTPCGGEVRHGVTSGISRETSINNLYVNVKSIKHVSKHET